MSPGRLFSSLRYFCADAWDEWRHSKAVNLMALATLTAALFAAALVTLVIVNIDRRIQTLRGEARVDVYLRDGHDAGQVGALRAGLERIPGVARVEYVDKGEALRRYRQWATEMAELVGELESNPLPASLEVFFRDEASALEGAEAIAGRLADSEAVEEVRFRRDWIRRLQALLGVARIGGGAVAALVLAAVVFVMAAVLRLAVYGRRDEIEIMQLVGATPSFIRGPFLVAGALQGLLAALLSVGLVEGVRRAALAYPGAASAALVELLAARPLPTSLVAGVLAVGLAVSVTGSWFAVREPM